MVAIYDTGEAEGTHYIVVEGVSPSAWIERQKPELRSVLEVITQVADASFSFSKAYTQRNPESGDSTSGQALASFLLGYPSGGSTDVTPYASYSHRFAALYVQDDIKLTLNAGLRWDVQTAPTERFNRLVYTFDQNLTYKLGNAQAKGGYVFAD